MEDEEIQFLSQVEMNSPKKHKILNFMTSPVKNSDQLFLENDKQANDSKIESIGLILSNPLNKVMQRYQYLKQLNREFETKNSDLYFNAVSPTYKVSVQNNARIKISFFISQESCQMVESIFWRALESLVTSE